VTRSPLIATLALALLVAACGSPGTGVSYFPTDTDGSDSVLMPDTTPADTAQPDTTAADTAPADTAQPVDTTPVDTYTPPDTQGGVPCTAGNACTDNDACTINDTCVDGFCEGQRLTCNDDVECTVDSCSNGVCHNDPPAGQCLIGGTTCVAGDQPNPDNPCQKCMPTLKAEGWSNDDGAVCSDNDPCTLGEACSGGFCTGGEVPEEICEDDIDNDCNSLTDDEDPVCNDNPPCTYHTDCFPDKVCGFWPTTGQNHCSEACAATTTCPGGQVCVKVPGSMQIGYCRAGVPGTLVNGAGCSTDNECISGLCAGVCLDMCMSDLVCGGANTTCQAVGNTQVINGACAPTGSAIGNGQSCTTDNENYDPALCASGHCDFMNFSLQALQGQQLTGPALCKSLCKSELDCLPSSEECNIVLYADSENPATVPPSPSVQTAMRDTLAACYTPAHTGGGPVGQACSQNSDCSSAKCLPGLDDDNPNQGYCASYCEYDQECPSGMGCQLSAVTINSQYLTITSAAFEGQVQGPVSAYTLVRICKFE